MCHVNSEISTHGPCDKKNLIDGIRVMAYDI